jgi:predicted DNA-binding protein (MmcQ/YjbR family)
VNAKQRRAFDRVLAHALTYPGAWEDHPWDETVAKVAKVGKKIFLFAFGGDGTLSLSMKLPESGEFALGMDCTEPTGYGLGRSGWVSTRFSGRDAIPVDLLCDWIDESYRAVAPKRLVRDLDARMESQ